MANLFKQIYGKVEHFVLRNAAFNKVATTYYDKGGGRGIDGGQIPYKRQGADMRTKEIADWQKAVMEATDPESPRRYQLHYIYQNLLRDDDLQATIENRVLPLQMATFKIVNRKTGEVNEAAHELLERLWFQELRRMSVMFQLQGTLLVDLTEKVNQLTMEIEEIAEVPQCNYIAQMGAIVKEPSDTEGISYREGGMEHYYYQFGKDWDLGLLNVLAIPIFAKKLGFGSWISYVDQYGIPFMFIVTQRMDTTRRDELYEMMSDMRSGRFGVLQGQETISFGKEANGSTTDAFSPFMDKCHNIITRLILGQTGTTNNEAYEGTSEVHERVEKYRHEADKLLFMYMFNKEIIPRLVKISPVYSIFEGCRLEWDDHETLSIKDYITAIKDLAYTFDFDPELVAEMTGLPITGMKEITNQGMQSGGNIKDGGKRKGEDDPEDHPDPPEPSKKKARARANGSLTGTINALYYNGGKAPQATDDPLALSDKIRDRVLNRLRSKGFDVDKDIDPDLFAHTFDCLDGGIRKSLGKPEFGTPDYDFLQQMRNNAATFSAFKTHRQQRELYGKMFDQDGNVKPFDQFRKDSGTVLDEYNVNWLRTEYDTCISRARFAADFRRYQAQTDLYPNLQWLPSVSVDRREGHSLFYNRIWPADDPFWLTNYPGSLWNCKCGMTNTDKPATDGNPKHAAAHEQPQPGIDTNPGITGEVFTPSHPYIKEADEGAKEAVENFLYKEYTKVPTEKGVLRIHDKHGKTEKAENIKVGKYLAEKHGYEIDLIENPDDEKSADSFNHTLGCFQEYKVNQVASRNAIDRALRSGKDQANDIVLWIETDISLEDLSAAIRPRVNRAANISHVTVVRDGKDRRYSRDEILSEGFKIRQADLE
jgi:hypothetical protein|nr:MAG TPA: minor capsid component [Caudoviricetes sp.]